MPIHDWTRVDDGVFHDFHTTWIGLLRTGLNSGLLPQGYYAMAEQVAGGLGPDVLRSLVIRLTSEHQIITRVEIVSAGNKASRAAFRTFIDKSAAVLSRGIHLLLIDLFPPGPRDPEGVHGALREALGDETFKQPADKPLALIAYAADEVPTAYVEPVAVGDRLPDMPLFLDPQEYINLPLEATYQTAFAGTAEFYRNILEAPPS